MIDEQQVVVPGLLAVRDEPRADRRHVVADLKAMGVRSIMLTGDDRRTADAIAAGLGLGCESTLLPQHKLRLVNQTKLSSRVAMVGAESTIRRR
ncbi:HAD family hydrolase [Stenotrophomonas sp. TWI602]|uniref:HAD family hydrolase n=1 Tax=Stenotrophomonas sp. TWI602 TaxID=3136786 RepID=UPI003207D46E